MAYVNLGRAFDEYEKTKRLDKQLQERQDAKQAEREQMVQEIRRMREELELMSDKGREDRQTAIEEKVRALQEFDRKTSEALKRERDTMMKEIMKEIEETVQGYAQRQGYAVVLGDRAILYADKGLDITDGILQQLNGREKGR